MSDRFSLLFLCAGNRFRSPLAAAFVRRLTLGLPVEVASAGMLQIGDSPPLPEARTLGAWCGVDLSAHRARQLTPDHLCGVDLLLGFEQVHVRHAVVDAGAARARAFTLGELVSLLRELEPPTPGCPPVDRARERIRRADERRVGDSFSVADDMPDPFGGSKKVYRTMAIQIQRLSLELVDELFGVTESAGLVLID